MPRAKQALQQAVRCSADAACSSEGSVAACWTGSEDGKEAHQRRSDANLLHNTRGQAAGQLARGTHTAYTIARLQD